MNTQATDDTDFRKRTCAFSVSNDFGVLVLVDSGLGGGTRIAEAGDVVINHLHATMGLADQIVLYADAGGWWEMLVHNNQGGFRGFIALESKNLEQAAGRAKDLMRSVKAAAGAMKAGMEDGTFTGLDPKTADAEAILANMAHDANGESPQRAKISNAFADAMSQLKKSMAMGGAPTEAMRGFVNTLIEHMASQTLAVLDRNLDPALGDTLDTYRGRDRELVFEALNRFRAAYVEAIRGDNPLSDSRKERQA